MDAMKVATESLSQQVHRQATAQSLWLSAIPRGSYNKNTGLTQTTFTVENSQPTDDTESWSSISLSTGSSDNFGACANSYTDVEVGFTETTYSPEQFQLRGPVVCSTDLLFDHNPNAFLSAYVQEMVKRSKKSWENKLIEEYMKQAEKVELTGSGSTSAIVVDSTRGTALESLTLSGSAVDLEQGHLDSLAIRLIENGATEGDSNGFINLEDSGPVFPLVIGMEASNKLASNNADLRSDLRYGEPNQLLKAMGASRVIGNFRHVPTVNPVRFTESGGVYTRVNQYVEGTSSNGGAATKGKKYNINPDWRTATHEAAFVINPSVLTTEIVAPAGYGLDFDAVNYGGEWDWITGGDKIGAVAAGADPQETLGRHFAKYMAAFRPVRPQDGAVILFAR
tara:strand:+ start:496 stop:1680 length:1185 start_codon:yes stop_codon:yes gene_type:complete